jgi:hypothetical protein
MNIHVQFGFNNIVLTLTEKKRTCKNVKCKKNFVCVKGKCKRKSNCIQVTAVEQRNKQAKRKSSYKNNSTCTSITRNV